MTRGSRLTRWLQTAPTGVFTTYVILVAFTTYFCMYAFRKPFAAAEYADLYFLGTSVKLKTAFVISQIIGYALSKYLGIKVCSEARGNYRAWLLIGFILLAELALLLFAIAPRSWKVAAIFFNGLPLGMVWGLVVSYLEGRRTSEFLLAGLSCSYIVASGITKDVGRYFMQQQDISEFWMPFTTGLVFLPLFLLAVWLLNQIPSPSLADEFERVERRAMDPSERWAFLRQAALGLILLFVVYFFLTAFRDIRDNYGAEVFRALGYADTPAIFSRSELWVGFGVTLPLGFLALIRDNRWGLMAAHLVMAFGLALLGIGTWLLDQGSITGLQWMILIGLGAYFAYVPFGSMLFDRMIASLRITGTAVFAIYLADALGYTGSVVLQLYKDLGQADIQWLTFLRLFSYALAAGGTLLMLSSCVYFARKSVRPVERKAAVVRTQPVEVKVE